MRGCLVPQVVGSTSAGACYGKRSRYRRWYDEDDEEVEDHATLARTAQMDDVLDESIDTGLWVSPLFGRLAEHRFGCSGISLPLEECLLDGQELFPRGLQPDKREYEGYTGNAGPELTYTYHRALVVAWPRSRRGLLPYTPDSAAAALELAERRLQHLKAGGSGPVPSPSASGPSWGHRHDPAVLQQHLSRIECLQPHEPEAQGLGRVEWEAKLAVEAAVSWALQAGAGRTQRSKQKSWGAAAAEEGGRAALQRALQLVTAPQVVMLCGEEWRVRAGMRLLKALSGVAGLNLKDAGLQAAVAGAASSMASSDSFGEGVLSLATQHVERQLTGCYMLAMHVEMPVALQDRILHTIRGVVIGASEGMTASVAEAAAAAAAAAPAAVAGRSFALLLAADVCFLARLVYADKSDASSASGAGAGGILSGLAATFTSAVLRRGDCQALLQALLKEPVVHRALRRQHPDAVRLAEARMQYLEPRVAGGVPRPDFSLPHVSYPHDPKVGRHTARHFSCGALLRAQVLLNNALVPLQAAIGVVGSCGFEHHSFNAGTARFTHIASHTQPRSRTGGAVPAGRRTGALVWRLHQHRGSAQVCGPAPLLARTAAVRLPRAGLLQRPGAQLEGARVQEPRRVRPARGDVPLGSRGAA